MPRKPARSVPPPSEYAAAVLSRAMRSARVLVADRDALAVILRECRRSIRRNPRLRLIGKEVFLA